MKKLSKVLLFMFMFIPGLLLAQNNAVIKSTGPSQENNTIDPEKVLYILILGFIIVFILFIIMALSRATSALSETLGDNYNSKLNEK